METALQSFLDRTRVLIPAFNEEASLPGLLAEVRAQLPGASVAVVDDGSTDGTADVAQACGARVLRLPCNGAWARPCKPVSRMRWNAAATI